jgi:hypothetical protein
MSNKIIQLKDKDNNLLFPKIIAGSISDRSIGANKVDQDFYDALSRGDKAYCLGLDGMSVAWVCFDGILNGAVTVENTGLNVEFGDTDQILWSSTLKYFVLKHIEGSTTKYYSSWNAIIPWGEYEVSGYKASSSYQDDSTPLLGKLFFDQKNNVLYKYDGTSKTLVAIADKGAFDAVKAKVESLDGNFSEVDIDALDNLKDNNTVLSGTPASYSVLATIGKNKVKVGYMIVFSDNATHTLTQVLFTHYLLEEGNTANTWGSVLEGTLSTIAHDHYLHVYSRYYSFNTAAGTVGQWTKWKVAGGYDAIGYANNIYKQLTALEDSSLRYEVIS